MKPKLLLLLFILVVSFPGRANPPDTLRLGSVITKQLELDFNEQAITADAFIKFQLKGDWENFDYKFTQGTVNDNSEFIIKAKEYKPFVEGKDGIALTIKPSKKTPEGLHTLSMESVEVSKDLAFDKETLNLKLPPFYFLPPPPMPIYIKMLYGLAGLVLLFLITWFAFVKKDLYPKMTGLIQFEDGKTARLNDCSAFCLYTGTAIPKAGKSGTLGTLFKGKVGNLQILWPEELRQENKYVMVKPVKTIKGYRNSLAELKNVELVEGQKTLYHDQRYSVKDPNNEQRTSFVYNNINHQLQ